MLLTTDVAARGLDIPEVDLVIQCNPPEDVDSYIHRSGRTGRAGKNGVCICFYKPEEEMKLANVEYRAVSALQFSNPLVIIQTEKFGFLFFGKIFIWFNIIV